ncbi:hypothetical protein [Nocardiopsis ansamitocini]|uniref:Uncharacterized protein n=1 Tax=Nocardiopsis ansamitocini TaxID=1670832 RepID=A0A9W6P2D6_9ACTN|nr:hypothetical protein [Nocardiopsis ansamitocini]GLU45852.1 hypothetical protein Nans01_02030 [Nocardiopsis ansamitocini]
MGALQIPNLIMLIAIMAIPVSIFIAGIVYVMRVVRNGTEATLARATRRRELA